MAVGTRLRGNSGFYLTFKIGAGSATVLGDDVKSYELTNEPRDDSDVTFSEAAAGTGVVWTLALTAITSFSTGSLWNYLWTNVGTEVQVVLAPYGNTTATATQPHFTFNVTVGAKPGVSNEAGTSGEGAEFSVDLVATTDVTKVVA